MFSATAVKERPAASAESLELDLSSGTVRFPDVEGLRFALECRTYAPLAKHEELSHLSPEALAEQARNIRQVEAKLLRILDASIDEPLSIDHQLRELDIRVFSEDHGWREVMEALNGVGSEYDDYKRVAVVKYLQYLGARQDLIKQVFSAKVWEADGSPRPRAEREGNLRETAIFDYTELASARGEDAQWVRLPRGEPRFVRLTPGREIAVRLSVHEFRLVRGRYLHFVDGQGKEQMVGEGRSVVGRDGGCEVLIDSAYRAVSRRHLIIERPEEDLLALTDLSSHGTFLPVGESRPS